MVVNLKAPPVFRAEVTVDGAPLKGSATAPVTIVEFADVHCPFCKRVQPMFTQILSRFGLDLPAFEHRLSSGKHQAAVQMDVEEGTRLGVTGMPTLFINGWVLSGAQPLESFARVIEEELAQWATLRVDICEPRDFSAAGPTRCNMYPLRQLIFDVVTKAATRSVLMPSFPTPRRDRPSGVWTRLTQMVTSGR